MKVEMGAVLDGKVKGITKFGAFVDLGDNNSGMVHISEISSKYVKEVKDFLTEGQDVKVKVIKITEDGKIGLSIKRLEEKTREERKSNSHQKKKKPNSTVWNGVKKSSEPKDFEDMISKFKQSSEEKISALRKANESRRSIFSKHSHSK